MANKQLFASSRGRLLPAADTVNEAGGLAYALPPKAALAQLVMTGSLGNAFYVDAQAQLAALLDGAQRVEPLYVAQTAVFARRHGYMKDTPAVLVALLTLVSPDLSRRAFEQVIDNGRMLRNFVQVLRSGVLGRKSLGTAPKRLVQRWLDGRTVAQLMNDAVGQSPSLADIIKMVHPRPVNLEREAFYGWLLGRTVATEQLPEQVRAYESFKAALAAGDQEAALPAVNFQWLTALPLGRAQWIEIARRASWQTLRMNLNTYARHGVFGEQPRANALSQTPAHSGSGAGSGVTEPPADLIRELAAKLRDAETIRRARVFPFQLLATWRALDQRVPVELREALQDALEIALENVPVPAGKVYVLPDVSGSMGAPVTGWRQGATSKVTCRDAAALIASAILRRNPSAEVIAFDDQVWPLALNPRDSVTTNTELLARTGGGGTNTSLPLAWLNARQARGDLVVYCSDNASWMDSRPVGATETLRQWEAFRARNPAARLVCLDQQPYAGSQAVSRADILNIGGFSDAVFEVLGRFARGEHNGEHWVAAIEAVEV
ncbi:RNA-binding protein [uncultured Lamprocystis sp.]|jgi:60 kDa SS-A/Ro ribonucleoprotein|uniref:vWA domain-containing protein n=1 Tax=uncultured Lamprocystis sp. TaxID=543132 RepID=UPI0025F634B8|nr:RNA-binding protein [uncultured Lamprocystis sp.]